MTDVSEEFVLLGEDLNLVQEAQIMTRELPGFTRVGPVRIGLDRSGMKHLLFPLPTPDLRIDAKSRGVGLKRLELVVEGKVTAFIDLHCREATLGLVFDRLADDVLRRITEEDLSAEGACRKTLDDWRSLLRTAGETVPRETVLGLVGELEVLRVMGSQPDAAIAAWRGPSGSVHDFVREGHALEVKATSSVDGSFVSISNLDQLDDTGLDSLHLVVVHVSEDPRAESLDHRVESLLDMGFPRSELIRAVAEAGYVYESGDDSLPSYRVRSTRVWPVSERFPGLSRGRLSEAQLRGISRIRYELALDAAPARLPDEVAQDLLSTWCTR